MRWTPRSCSSTATSCSGAPMSADDAPDPFLRTLRGRELETQIVIKIEIVETSSLGDRSYLAHDGEVAVVVDPQRDIDRVLALAAEHGVRIAVVLETHVHNDY